MYNKLLRLQATANDRLNTYSMYERIGIEQATELQKALRYTSNRELIPVMHNGAVINFPVTVEGNTHR